MKKRLSEEEITQLRTRLAKRIQREKTPVALPPGRKLARRILSDGVIFMVALLIITLFPLGVYLWFTMGTTFLTGRNRVLLTIWETAIVLFFVFRWIRNRLYKNEVERLLQMAGPDVEGELISEETHPQEEQLYAQEMPPHWNAEKRAFTVEAPIKKQNALLALFFPTEVSQEELLTLRQLIAEDSSGNPEEKASLPKGCSEYWVENSRFFGVIIFWILSLFAFGMVFVLVLIEQLDHALNLLWENNWIWLVVLFICWMGWIISYFIRGRHFRKLLKTACTDISAYKDVPWEKVPEPIKALYDYVLFLRIKYGV
ncbi:hypothetical protein N8I82_08795 [Granulicatella adiacens]|uniref:hypothetical protein n=1 Tax=Granulicatella adiacens TaxID=46124 RepID=UPI0021D7DFE2|nr:hypothetical protein [Granulicatella adiacens]UXY41282.1 hypothetical protein N8I82_08795 [Granulicatella adiacens]